MQSFHIKKYGKELAETERTCEYVGIGIVRESFLPIFLKQLETLVDQGEYHLWWENVLYSLNERYPIHSHDVEGRLWGEVDTVMDYQNILKKESDHKTIYMDSEGVPSFFCVQKSIVL